jgi:hypothetical protein
MKTPTGAHGTAMVHPRGNATGAGSDIMTDDIVVARGGSTVRMRRTIAGTHTRGVYHVLRKILATAMMTTIGDHGQSGMHVEESHVLTTKTYPSDL